MSKPKFKTGDRVRIVSNDLQPQFVNKIGKIKKVFVSFSDYELNGHLNAYRIEVDGESLKGVAFEENLELI